MANSCLSLKLSNIFSWFNFKQQIYQLIKKKKDSGAEITIEDRVLLQKGLVGAGGSSLEALNNKLSADNSDLIVQLYGENLKTTFNPKANRILPELYAHLTHHNLQQLEFQEKI